MAKKEAVIRIPPAVIPKKIITKWDKEDKPGGNRIIIASGLLIPGQKIINSISTLVECNDGYYKVYNEEGKEMFYRVGEKVMKNIRKQE